MSTYVYVVEVGCYSDRYVSGVFATPEAAMVGRGGTFTRTAGDHDGEEYEHWSNDLDWESYVCIKREMVKQ